jgi:2-amino-4-hydroxy-6-hydroxymethyldihydropteridine diphosphokinase
MAALHRIEAELGRTRGQRWAARVCDLDLLDYDGEVLPNMEIWQHWRGLSPAAQAKQTPDQLILPHPRMQDRAFVLVPLSEIAPAWRHPVLGETARELRDKLPKSEIERIHVIDEA